jgi:hypothetical protein
MRVLIAGWILVTTALAAGGQPYADTEMKLEAAIHREVVVGDLAGAMDEYRAIIAQNAKSGRAAQATALLGIASCQEKLGEGKQAYNTYRKVVSEYRDQPDIIRHAQIKLDAWSGPRNLKFDEGIIGKVPPGWFVPSLPKDADYLAELRRDGCRNHSGCAVVLVPMNVPRPVGNLMQSFSAAAFAGKTVRLRAWLRMESFFFSPITAFRIPGPDDRAQMWINVERTNHRNGFSENMDDRPVRSSEWAPYDIVGEIDADAQFINLGFMSIGGGRLWVDDVSFEVIPRAEANAVHNPQR